MYKAKGIPKFVWVYVTIIIIFSVFSVYLIFDIQAINASYAFKQTDINMSGLCSTNVSTMIFFYGNNCPSCGLEKNAFQNVTSEFGNWSGDLFHSIFFCAYNFNITAYNTNQTNVLAPSGTATVFESLANGRIPFLFLGGEHTQYYKIGGFTTTANADQQLLQYICASINNVAPACA